MQTLIAVLFCLSPLLFGAAGYYLGRFGSPVVLRFQGRRDRRRRPAIEEESEGASVEVYTSNDSPALTPVTRSYD